MKGPYRFREMKGLCRSRETKGLCRLKDRNVCSDRCLKGQSEVTGLNDQKTTAGHSHKYKGNQHQRDSLRYKGLLVIRTEETLLVVDCREVEDREDSVINTSAYSLQLLSGYPIILPDKACL